MKISSDIKYVTLIRTLVAARRQLLKMVLQMANQIRGLMKTFGLVVPKGMGRIFDHHVRSLLASHAGLERIIRFCCKLFGCAGCGIGPCCFPGRS